MIRVTLTLNQSTEIELVTGFYYPVNCTGSHQDDETQSQANVHFKTSHIYKPILKSVHKTNPCTNIKH